MKKWIALFMALMMAVPLVACKPSKPNNGPTATDSGSNTTQDPDPVGDPNSRENIKDDLPELDFERAVLKIGYTLDAYDDRYGSIGSETGDDLVAYDIYKRNLYVEDRFNCLLNFVPFGESLATWESVNDIVYKQMLQGGEDCADVFMCTEHQLTASKIYNMFTDANNLEYVNLEKPYWWTNMMQECSLDGRTLPFLMGDISMLNYLKAGVLYYNKNLFSRYYADQDPNTLYNMVLDGTWTIDALMEYTKDVYRDVNGNAERDSGDLYGMIIGDGSAVWGGEYLRLMMGFDLELYSRKFDKKANMEIPVIDMNNERVRNSIEKIHKLINLDGVFVDPNTTLDNNGRVHFAPDLALFFPGRFSAAQSGNFKDMESDYGVLIMPKYDLNQQNYKTYVADSCATTALPTGKSRDTYRLASVVLEAMACYNYKVTAVTLLDKLLSTQYASDEITGQVVDLVAKTATKNFVAENRGVTKDIIWTGFTASVTKNDFVVRYGARIDAANEELRSYLIDLYS